MSHPGFFKNPQKELRPPAGVWGHPGRENPAPPVLEPFSKVRDDSC